MNARTALEKWLAGLSAERLTALLEERELPRAAGYSPVTTFRQLAEHLLTDDSVERAVAVGTGGEAQLAACVAARALETYGPVPVPEQHTYAWRPAPPPVDPYTRLVPEAEVLDWLEQGGTPRERTAEALQRLRERALVLPAPPGRLALPSLLHTSAARMDGYGRPADLLFTQAYNAPEIKRIAAALGIEQRTRADAQAAVGALLADPGRVRELVATAPAAAHELLDHMLQGPCCCARTASCPGTATTRDRTASTRSGRAAAGTRVPTGSPNTAWWSRSGLIWWNCRTRSVTHCARISPRPRRAWTRNR